MGLGLAYPVHLEGGQDGVEKRDEGNPDGEDDFEEEVNREREPTLEPGWDMGEKGRDLDGPWLISDA